MAEQKSKLLDSACEELTGAGITLRELHRSCLYVAQQLTLNPDDRIEPEFFFGMARRAAERSERCLDVSNAILTETQPIDIDDALRKRAAKKKRSRR